MPCVRIPVSPRCSIALVCLVDRRRSDRDGRDAVDSVIPMVNLTNDLEFSASLAGGGVGGPTVV